MRTRLAMGGGLLAALAGGLWQQGLLDTQPPSISATLPTPPGDLRGTVLLSLSAADDAPGLRTLTVQLDDDPPQPIAPGTTEIPLDTTTLPDGAHRLVVRAVDGAWVGNEVSVALDFFTDNTAPSLEIASGSLGAVQGQTLAIYLRPSEPLSALTGELLGQQRIFYELGDGLWRALVGVDIRAEVGSLPLRLALTDTAGNTSEAAVPLTIAAGSFPRGGMIRLTPAQEAARKDDRNRAKTRKERDDVYSMRLPAARWEGTMQRPTAGRRTSGFGRYRTYSDGRRSYHHGTDLASPTGTPVAAAAPGVVRKAGWQHIFGNAVMVDHGQGVSTSYNHLSAVDVTVGQEVAAGDVVGKVGSTGQSTGPHLHWAVVVDGVAVDAEQWLEHSFLAGEYDQFADATQIDGAAVWPASPQSP